MAPDSPLKQEFRIRDLGTRSVLLFPTRAQIIRDLKDVALVPGPNQIIIDGLAPTVDEHSIKVEGTGAATISEVSVDLLPNRDVYEDVYPSDTEDEDDDETESEPENESMKTIEKKIKQLIDALLAETEKINSAANRLQICDNFGKSLVSERPPPEKLPDILKAYNEERKKIFEDHAACTTAAEKVQEDIAKAQKEKTKLAKELVKTKLKAQKEKTKLKEKKIRKKAEIFKEKQRIKAERDSFWAKKVYRVTISLETSTLTPGSSRRSSITEGEVTSSAALDSNLATTTFHEPEALKAGLVSLSISYITYSASWSPRYDLNLNSLKCAGILEYGAELKNTTSETWRDAKVILSTSQTTFSGLSEKIPTLYPWHVRLQKGPRNSDSALMSQYEQNMKRQEWTDNSNQSQKPRHLLFGVDTNAQNEYVQEHHRRQAAKVVERGEALNQLQSKTADLSQSAFAFGQRSSAAAPAPQATGYYNAAGGGFSDSTRSHTLRQRMAHNGERRSEFHREKAEAEEEDEEMGFGLFDDGSAAPSGPRPDVNSLVFEEGAWEESGMTTTYDVPGLKTLVPSNSTIKHKIAKIDFKNIIFSHIVIGKLRQVAFLKARLRNASKITLLKGPLGLSLDGSFLGQAILPRCSASESFSLPLGVDPAIQILYTKPTVRRSQSGIFSKEDSNVFTRTMTITNTKNNAPVELTVLDQVPVSEDERLRIEITAPRNLKPGSEPVRTGMNATSSFALTPIPTNTGGTLSKGSAQNVRASAYGSENGKEVERQVKWGSAEAIAKKAGEVAWNVRLNPGCGVKLVLEYEATFPGGEMVVGL